MVKPTIKDTEKLHAVGDTEQVTASRAFLELCGKFKVGPGDPVEDVRKAREQMGTRDA